MTDARLAPGDLAPDFTLTDQDGRQVTLSELREEASELDIPGRSKMNRDELTAALIEANTFA